MKISSSAKRSILSLILIQLSIFSSSALSAEPGSVDIRILTELNQGYLDSYRSGNVDFYDRILTEDFRETAPDGTILNKAEFLAKIGANSGRQGESMEIAAGELEIRIFEDTAIVHAIPVISLPDGVAVNGGRYTDVYVRIDGEWKCVAAHLGGS